MRRLSFGRILLGFVLCTVFLTACSSTDEQTSSSSNINSSVNEQTSSSSDINSSTDEQTSSSSNINSSTDEQTSSSSNINSSTDEQMSSSSNINSSTGASSSLGDIENIEKPKEKPIVGKPEVNINETDDKNDMTKIDITVGDTVFTATLENNPTTKAVIEKFPLNVSMGELNGNEKYYFMDTDFPTNSRRFDLIKAGDIVLYQSNCLVIFYEDCRNSYSYTKLGTIDDVSKLKATLGASSINVNFSVQK